jgi:hypothetical protein
MGEEVEGRVHFFHPPSTLWAALGLLLGLYNVPAAPPAANKCGQDTISLYIADI